MFKDYIVLLHGIIKRSSEVPTEDMLKAKYRMMNFQKRINQGNIKLPKID
jgi:phage-related protein